MRIAYLLMCIDAQTHPEGVVKSISQAVSLVLFTAPSG